MGQIGSDRFVIEQTVIVQNQNWVLDSVADLSNLRWFECEHNLERRREHSETLLVECKMHQK